MTRYRYPPGPLLGDYARATAGLVLTGLPPLLLPLSPWVGLPLAVAAGLFVLFAARTAQRHVTIIEMDDNGIHARGPLGGSIPWDHLSQVRLNYYSTRRDRGLGWMQLRLKGTGAGETVRIESTLDGFDEIAERVAGVARQKGDRHDRHHRQQLPGPGHRRRKRTSTASRPERSQHVSPPPERPND